MASEIRVNRLSNRSGLSTITFANGGVQFSGITTFANGDFRVGTGATILNPSANEMQFHTGGSNRLTINNSGVNLGTGNITAVDATFSGNVSIGKTLTYEDVKNVDSVGVVTARTGVKITGGDFTVGTAITASVATGNVTQDVGITTFSGTSTWFKGTTANKDMYWSKSSGSLIFKDTAAAIFGNSSDLQISHNGTHSQIKNATGDLQIWGDHIDFWSGDGQERIFESTKDGAVKLYFNASKKFETTTEGIEVTGKIIPSSHIDMADSVKLLLGTGDDYQIWHDGSNGFLSNNTGYLLVNNTVSPANDVIIRSTRHVYLQPAGGEQGVIANQNGSVDLYHNNVKKLATTSSGVEVTGVIYLNQSQSKINLDTSDGSDNKFLSINGGGDASQSRGAGITFYGNEVGSHEGKLQILAGNSGSANGVILMYTGGAERLRIDSTGRLLIGTSTAAGNGVHVIYSTVNSAVEFQNNTTGTGSGRGLYVGNSTSATGYLWNYANNALVFATNNAERMRIHAGGQLSLGTASQTQGQFGILNTNNFSTASVSTNTDNIWLISDATSGDGVYGASIGFSRVQYADRRAAAIATVQEGTDEDHVGLAFFTHPSANATDPVVEKLRIAPSGLVKVTDDLMVQGTVYGGNGGRRNWFDNGAMNVIQRYQNCHVVGNYHSYGWAIDRFQNRGGNSQWQRSTNVPSGKGFDYALKVGSGTGGAICQGIELMNQGKPGPFAVGTFWCISFWSTQPVNTASNNGFCQDLGGTNYIPLSLRTPSSGNAYAETGETASGTASGTYKRYYAIFEVTSGPHANNHTLNFGWAFNYSGSGTNEWTGFQCEQVPNASCKPSDYEHVDYATDLKRCQRYCWRSTACRYVNGYKRHDSQVNFGIQCPVPMTPYTVSNGGGTIGVVAWDYGTLTDFGGVWQNPAGTAIGLYEMDYNNGYCVIHLTTAYTGCSHCVVPSWESAQFEVACGPF